MEDSPIGLDKWLPVMWLIANCRNGISSWEIHRDLGVTQKTAWFMLHRVRLAMQDDKKGGRLSGEVEVDESYIGGKARNMHKASKAKKLKGKRGGYSHKIGVQGILERGGHIRTHVIDNSRYGTVVPNVEAEVEKGSHVYTDQLKSYVQLQGDEQAFRYNHWKNPDGSSMSESDRFNALCSHIVGRRLTYKDLTGKEAQKQAEEEPF